jgi:hypothetical protein
MAQRVVLEANKTGAFNMDVVHEILAQADIIVAKKIAEDWLNAVDNARDTNIKKAYQMVTRTKSVKDLGMGMSNFILAFQGLSVIK